MLRKLPWASLSMLVLTYITFGWLMSASIQAPLLPVFGAVCIAIVMAAFTLPLKKIKKYLDIWSQSKLRSMAAMLLGVFSVVIVISALEISVRVLVIVAASLLARIDLINQGISKDKIFVILSLLAFSSYVLGVVVHEQLVILGILQRSFLR
ncbi:MAG: hypothetical protein HC916_02470 [Coleofasciculaceae cyanobacterium SM2_1_6]|nr:hypothetical protein [Coleofasciculaceae cyanobacterium SM2_1_6]